MPHNDHYLLWCFYVTPARSWPHSISLSHACICAHTRSGCYIQSVLHYSCGVAAVTFLERSLSFTPSSWGYCICCRTHILCVRSRLFLSAQDTQAYCLAGWPLSCNVATELYIYVWSNSSIHLFYHRFLLISCSPAHSRLVFHSFTNRLLIHVSALYHTICWLF